MKLIRKLGSDLLCPQPNNFDDSTVLWIHDTFDYDDLDQLIERNGKPKYIVNDHNFGHFGKNFYCAPFFLAAEVHHRLTDLEIVDEVQSTSCFNFIINKKSVNRSLLLKLVEYFQLSTNEYTWYKQSPYFDLSSTIQELKVCNDSDNFLEMTLDEYRNFHCELLAPCKIDGKFIDFPSQTWTDSSVDNYGGNSWAWSHGLNEIFQNSAVSLISESVEYQKASCVTEKTAYSVLGLTFPLWVGGYGIADAWKKLGLDIFPDIIDHRYQFKETLIERCYYAFRDNLHLLTDLKLVSKLRKKCHSRLLINREKLLDGILIRYCDNTVQGWPKELHSMPRQVWSMT
jgi:hypothetical protein